MAQTSFLCLLLFFSIFCTSPVAMAKKSGKSDFIRTSCGVTQYPDLCFESLSVFRSEIRQSPRQIAQTALHVSLSRARSVRSYVSTMTRVKGIKGRDLQAVKDCVDNMGDSVDRLSKSIKELGEMSKGKNTADFMWHMSNVQTWVSAALTDENTCTEGFTGHGKNTNYRAGIRRRVTGVAQVTSNALALVNHFAAKHY
ncbi:hypothetical protein MKW94_005611 [Papaver nudicaule]|uniref:Pectinesterase inhibitor domain-containing protein n=1 Tax=Papaver nudicaule TaxID=74823 RepID=A0AA41SAX6_PAPNU|nr:hypothetical protein [Papaver nudicaule]